MVDEPRPLNTCLYLVKHHVISMKGQGQAMGSVSVQDRFSATAAKSLHLWNPKVSIFLWLMIKIELFCKSWWTWDRWRFKQSHWMMGNLLDKYGAKSSFYQISDIHAYTYIMHACIHVHTLHTYIHTYIHTHTHTYTHTHRPTYMYTHAYLPTYIRGGSRNSSMGGGGGSGPEFFEGGGLGSRSTGIFIYILTSKTPLRGG